MPALLELLTREEDDMDKDQEPGLRREDVTPCHGCGKGLGHQGPVIYRVTVQQLFLDGQAIQELSAMETLCGSPQIAAVMSPVQDLASPTARWGPLLLCQECVLSKMIADAMEDAAPDQRDNMPPGAR